VVGTALAPLPTHNSYKSYNFAAALTYPCEERTDSASVIAPGFGIETGYMSDSYIIEVSSQAAGIVVRDVSGYRFFAASQPFYRLDGRLFRHVADAQRAATQLANGDLNAA
jgi:hypothetical protein